MVEKYNPIGALNRLGEDLADWIERRNCIASLADFLVKIAETARFEPKPAILDYITALYWSGRQGAPSGAAIEAVVAAHSQKRLIIKRDTLIPLIIDGQIPRDWPIDLVQVVDATSAASADPPPGVDDQTMVEPAPCAPGDSSGSSTGGEHEAPGTATIADVTAAFLSFPEKVRAMKRTRQLEKIRSRRGTCGATDAVAILGLSPWKGPLEVWLDKTAAPEDVLAWEEARGNQERLEDGHRLEPVVAGWWAEQHPEWDVTGDGEKSYTHLTIPWASASPDRLVMNENAIRILEIKTSESWPWPAVPDYYVAQVCWQHLVLSSHIRHLQNNVIVAVRFHGGSYREYLVPIDPMRVDAMLREVSAWWERHIMQNVAPSVRGAADPDGSIQRLHREGTLDHLKIESLGDRAGLAEKLVADLVKWQGREKLANEVKDAIRGQLGELIGSHRGLVTTQHKVTWYNVAGKTRIDWESIARRKGATENDIAIATSRGVSTRQWRITEIKGGTDGTEST
jgi:predicted phage-related endonuclease